MWSPAHVVCPRGQSRSFGTERKPRGPKRWRCSAWCYLATRERAGSVTDGSISGGKDDTR